MVVTDAERAAVLAEASPHVKLWLLLCADMAIRSGTAARIGPEHYDSHRRLITFSTKYGEKLTLPTTKEIETLLDECDMRNPEPFVRQLWYKQKGKYKPHKKTATTRTQQIGLLEDFRRIKTRVGITRRIVPHDMRRTAAVAIYMHTRDIRDAQALLGHRTLQSTLWYLDHNLRPVSRETLETIKRPFLVKKEQTA